MRLEIWSGKVEEKPTYLTLTKAEDGYVELGVADADGRVRSASTVLVITPDGCVKRCEGLWPGFGFKLDERGRVQLKE